MSLKKKKAKEIVVDASIARAASTDGNHPVGAGCRNFLIVVDSAGHDVAMNNELYAEWRKHRSRFASTWLVKMVSQKRLAHYPDEADEAFLQRILDACSISKMRAAVEKDLHLVTLAFVSHQRIASLDEVVRGHLCTCADVVTELDKLIWVNPATEDDLPEWLAAGAPAKGRSLRP